MILIDSISLFIHVENSNARYQECKKESSNFNALDLLA
jgi:hypothetical protein